MGRKGAKSDYCVSSCGYGACEHTFTHIEIYTIRRLNVRDEGHIQGLAKADYSSVVLRDNERIGAGCVQDVRQTVCLEISACEIFVE